MVNYELNSQDENFKKRLIELFKGIILCNYPIVQNRWEKMHANQENYDKRLDISIEFRDKKGEYTDISIGNHVQILVKGFIDVDTLYQLLNFLIQDHDVIKEFHKNGPYIYLSSIINYENKPDGMLCNEINVALEFARLKSKGNFVASCEEMIIKHFKNNIYWKSYFKENQKEEMKANIQALTEKDVMQIKHTISLMNMDEIKHLLHSLPYADFSKIYSGYQNFEEVSEYERTRRLTKSEG